MSARRYFIPRHRRRASRRSLLGRLLDVVVALAILALVGLVASRWPEPGTATMTGRVVVFDGDTIAFGTERVRLRGIDAPEQGQECQRQSEAYDCGRQARVALEGLIGRQSVTCVARGRDRYGRLLAECAVGQILLNREMVELGWAIAYGGYGDAERRARAASRGLWAGEFERPEEWRKRHGQAAGSPFAGVWDWFLGLLGR